jgi:carnosine N-methyltransferase
LRQGYETQGNEHSWFMLISSAFVLNGAEAPGQFVIHPWVASSNNQPSTAAQLRGVATLLSRTCL